jgi:serine protease Do
MAAIAAGLLAAVVLRPDPASALDSAPPDAFERLAQVSGSYEALAERVLPSVVQVFASGYTAGPRDASTAANLLSKERSTGSGVILDKSGYIVTNAHVVAGASRIQVLLPRAREDDDLQSILKPRGRLLGAQLVGFDREADVAVLRIEGGGDLAALELGDSDSLRQAQLVFAFGSPLGLESSVSAGVVSSVARQIRPDDPMIYIQTDASINPGNSGGPLVDATGKVVGLNTFIFSQSGGDEGIGFAVPSNIVRNVFDQLRKTGHVRRGEIGVHAQTITPALARGLGLKREWGVILGDVAPGGPAANAGLRPGDIILSLDGKQMENGRQFDVNVYRRPVGATIRLDVQRGDDRRTYSVSVVDRADDPSRFAQLVSPENNLIPRLGVLAIDINEDVTKLLPELRQPGGVLVAAVASVELAWEEGFEVGDVIHSVNGTPINTLAALRSAASAFKSGDAVVAQVERRGRLLFVAFELE